MPDVDATRPDAVRAELVRLWTRFLGSADETSHFFREGGNSLQAARMLTAIRAAFGVRVRFKTLLDHPRPADLAGYIAAAATRAVPPDTAARGLVVRPGLATVDAPVTAMQADRLARDRYYLDRGVTPPPHNVSAALHLRGDLDVPALRAAIRGVVARHPALRTVFDIEVGRQRVLPPADVAVELEIVEVAPDSLTERLGELANQRFDLRVGPLVRAVLVPLVAEAGDEAEHVFLFVVEHLAADGVSMQVILDDLAQAYGVALPDAAGTPAEPVSPLSFLDYAAAEHEWLHDHQGEPAFSYWRGELQEVAALPYREIPLGQPARPGTTAPVRARTATLPPDLFARLRERTVRDEVPWFSLITAAAHVTVARLGDFDEVTSVSMVANRPAGAERTVGWFANPLAFTTRQAHRADRQRLPTTLRDRQFAGFDHAEIPFWHLMAKLRGHDSRERPDNCWLYVDVESPTPGARPPRPWPGLTVRRRPVPLRVAGLGLDISAVVTADRANLVALGRADRFADADLDAVLSSTEDTLRTFLPSPS